MTNKNDGENGDNDSIRDGNTEGGKIEGGGRGVAGGG